MDDMELLREYATKGSEAAFETLVQRHVNLVYSAAFRLVHDPMLSGEVTQTVFIILARKARTLRPGTILSGWLYRTAQFAASKALRTELRRRKHEQEAAQMKPEQVDSNFAWEQIAPLLDEGMAHLGDSDRNAVVLRYFENKNLKDVGAAFGSNERAAQKRVARAIEKLRVFFTKRGVVLPAMIVATALSANAVQAAPAGMASVAAAAAVKGSAATASTAVLLKATLKLMAWMKFKTAAVISAGVLLAVGTTTLAVKEMETPRQSGSVPDPVYQGKRLSVWLEAFNYEKHKFEGPEAREAKEAVRHIGTNGIPLLLWMLRAKDADLSTKNGEPSEKRNEASEAFRTLGASAKDAVPELIAILEQKLPAASQYGAEKALRWIGPPAAPAVPWLLRATDHTNSGIRLYALGALGPIHAQPDVVVPVLMKHLHDPGVNSRMFAAESLGDFGTNADRAVPMLVELLNDKEWIVRMHTLRALGRIHTEPELVVPALMRFLHKPDASAQSVSDQWRSIEGLQAFGAEARPAVPTLIELLLTGPDEVARGMAASALGQIHAAPELVVPALAKSLHDPSAIVRLDAATALGEFGAETKAATAVLAELLTDQDAYVREMAGKTLKKTEPEAAAKARVQ